MAETIGSATHIHPWVTESQTRLQFGISGGSIGDWSALRDFVQAAEAAVLQGLGVIRLKNRPFKPGGLYSQCHGSLP